MVGGNNLLINHRFSIISNIDLNVSNEIERPQARCVHGCRIELESLTCSTDRGSVGPGGRCESSAVPPHWGESTGNVCRPLRERARGTSGITAAVVRLLGALLTELAKGNAVTLMPYHAELTTQEAADLLNVSRPFLVGLLESGQLPHHKVGTHRRVRFADLMIYKRRRDTESEAALRELAALSQDMKLDT